MPGHLARQKQALALPGQGLAGTSRRRAEGQNEVRPQIQCSRCSRAQPGAWGLHIRVVKPTVFLPLHSSGVLSHCPVLPAQASQHKCLTPSEGYQEVLGLCHIPHPQIPLSSQGLSSLGHQGHRVGWGQLSAGQIPPLVTGYTTQEPGCPLTCCGRHRQAARDPILSSSCSTPPSVSPLP